MDAIDKDFIGLYRQIANAFGMDNLMVTLFAKLYIEPREVSMEELAKETGYSLASVSNIAKVLVPIGFIKKTTKPGSKKIFLYTEKDFTKIIKENLLKKENHGLRFLKENLPDIIKKYRAKAKTETEKKKVKILESYYEQILKFEGVLHKMIKQLDKI